MYQTQAISTVHFILVSSKSSQHGTVSLYTTSPTYYVRTIQTLVDVEYVYGIIQFQPLRTVNKYTFMV